MIVGCVSTWRITHMLLTENGPFRLLRRLRERFGVVYVDDDSTQISSFKYEITTCPWCLSVWVGLAVTLSQYLPYRGRYILLPFMYSAASVFIGKLMERKLKDFSEFRIQ